MSLVMPTAQETNSALIPAEVLLYDLLRTSQEGEAMSFRVWEWVVDQGADRALSGVSGARHQAMKALSRTLIAARAPACGRVVQIVLADGADGCGYVRLAPALRADCDEGIITWSLPIRLASGGGMLRMAGPGLISRCRRRPGCIL